MVMKRGFWFVLDRVVEKEAQEEEEAQVGAQDASDAPTLECLYASVVEVQRVHHRHK